MPIKHGGCQSTQLNEFNLLQPIRDRRERPPGKTYRHSPVRLSRTYGRMLKRGRIAFMHLADIDNERKLESEATCKEFLQVRQEGARQVRRCLRHYYLASILAVGYRFARRPVRRAKVANAGEPLASLNQPLDVSCSLEGVPLQLGDHLTPRTSTIDHTISPTGSKATHPRENSSPASTDPAACAYTLPRSTPHPSPACSGCPHTRPCSP